MAPAATPPEIIERMSQAIAEVAQMPEIVAQRREAFSDSVGSTSAEFDAFLTAQRGKWVKVIQQTGLRLK